MGYWGWPELDCTPPLPYESYNAAGFQLVAVADDEYVPPSLPFGFSNREPEPEKTCPPDTPIDLVRDAWMWW